MPDAIAAQTNFTVNRLRVFVNEKNIVGALLMGDQTLSRALHHIIVQKVDISPIRDRMMVSDSAITEVIADFWASISMSSERSEYAAIKS
jgi:NAD(P)H-nitrite reductase large subunit